MFLWLDGTFLLTDIPLESYFIICLFLETRSEVYSLVSYESRGCNHPCARLFVEILSLCLGKHQGSLVAELCGLHFVFRETAKTFILVHMIFCENLVTLHPEQLLVRPVSRFLAVLMC